MATSGTLVIETLAALVVMLVEDAAITMNYQRRAEYMAKLDELGRTLTMMRIDTCTHEGMRAHHGDYDLCMLCGRRVDAH